MEVNYKAKPGVKVPKCPSCGYNGIRTIGKLCPIRHFAGRKLDEIIDGGYLLKCNLCKLHFRYPSKNKVELDSRYKDTREKIWKYSIVERIDWQIAASLLKSYVQQDASILDVGCYDGEFLHGLSQNYNKFGIEINPQAANAAKKNGVNIIGSDYNELDTVNYKYDAVVAFDMIEHTIQPFHFIRNLSNVLKEGGILIVSSGNTKSISWRIMGSRYWYCSIGEHISFINLDWCNYVANQLKLILKHYEFFSHGNFKSYNRLLQGMKNIFFCFMPRYYHIFRSLYRKIFSPKSQETVLEYPPLWDTAADHFICLFIKP